jgi:hypothetical protein
MRLGFIHATDTGETVPNRPPSTPTLISKYVSASQALENARQALERGDKQTARIWAQQAAKDLPNSEVPWLILAAVSKPEASEAYYQRALEINPQCQQARIGLRAIQGKLEQTRQSTNLAQRITPRQSRTVARRKKSSATRSSRPLLALQILFPTLILALVLVLFAVWLARPNSASAALVDVQDMPQQLFDRQLPGQVLGSSESSSSTALRLPATDLPTLQAAGTATPATSASPVPSVISSIQSTTVPTVATLPPTNAPIFPSPTLPPAPTIAPLPQPTVSPAPTQAAVSHSLAIVPLPSGEFALARPPASGDKLITVSISNQQLDAYQGGVRVFSFIVSTGAGGGTFPGTYPILDKIPNAYDASESFWMPAWMGIYYNAGIEDGIHALPLLPNGQLLWANDLGTPVSYGCIVLGEQEAWLLYNWAEIGTMVQINP